MVTSIFKVEHSRRCYQSKPHCYIPDIDVLHIYFIMSTPQLDLKKPEPTPDAAAGTAAAADVKEEKLSSDALTKYQTASALLGEVLKKFIPTVVEGKSVLDLCNE